MKNNVYKRTILEVFGDLLATPGKRFLTSVVMAVACYLFGLVMGFFAFGFIVFMYVAISIIDDTKTFYVKSMSVKTNTGETIPCILVKQKCYAYCFKPLKFFCPFFYFPYRVRYYLLINVEASGMENGTCINDEFLAQSIVNRKELPKRYAKAAMDNPQVLEEELSEVSEYRNWFVQDVKEFFEEEILEEIYYNSWFSICRFYDGSHMLFPYVRNNGGQCGLGIKSTAVELFKENPALLWDVYVTGDLSVGVLNTTVLERLLLKKNGKSDVSSRVGQVINQNKKELTKEIIMNDIKPKTGWKMFGAFWLFYFALGGLCAVIGGIATGMFPVAIFGLVVLVLCVYCGIRVVKKAKEEKKNYLQGNIRVVASRCISVEEEPGEDVSGWIHKFSNGVVYSCFSPIAVAGDLCYLAYQEGKDLPKAYYNSVIYKPAEDLFIENYR